MDNTNRGYLIVTDYICVDGKSDVSDALQKLIDENPNRTLFFPDGCGSKVQCGSAAVQLCYTESRRELVFPGSHGPSGRQPSL